MCFRVHGVLAAMTSARTSFGRTITFSGCGFWLSVVLLLLVKLLCNPTSGIASCGHRCGRGYSNGGQATPPVIECTTPVGKGTRRATESSEDEHLRRRRQEFVGIHFSLLPAGKSQTTYVLLGLAIRRPSRTGVRFDGMQTVTIPLCLSDRLLNSVAENDSHKEA